jgi:hypothetical protein
MLFFCITTCIQKASAQASIQTNYFPPITLDYNNYVVPPLADYFRQGANASGVPVPKRGIHQKWDYSVLVKNDAYNSSQSYEHASNSMFQNARRQNNFVYVLGGIIALQETGYESDDKNSFSRIGRSLDLQKFPLVMLTGSASDSLIIDQQYDFDEGNFAMVTYPCAMFSSWSNDVRVTTQFHLSVAAFGYDHSPGQFVQREKLTRKVVGFGKMRIPSATGKTPYTDVLMIRSVHTTIDSVYINGKPAPDALLAAFGLTQGEKSFENSYVFLRQGIDEPLITFNMDSSFNSAISIQYDAKYADIYCDNKEKICYNGSAKCVPFAMVTPALLQSDLVTIGDCPNKFVTGKPAENTTVAALQKLKVFPNPSHDAFTLSFNNNERKMITVRVLDITGKVLLQLQAASQQISFGNQLTRGVYFAEVINGNKKETIKLVKL